MVLINLHHNASDFQAPLRSSEVRLKEPSTTTGREGGMHVLPEFETRRRTIFNAAPGSPAHGNPGSPARGSPHPWQPGVGRDGAHTSAQTSVPSSIHGSAHVIAHASQNSSVDGTHVWSDGNERNAGSEASCSGSGGAIGFGVVGKRYFYLILEK